MNKGLILLGATGALSKEKIFPILSKIENINNFQVAAYGRREVEEKPTIQNFTSIVGDFVNPTNLTSFLEQKELQCTYFYIALPPHLFSDVIKFIFDNFGKYNPKVALEKPFGDSLKEAEKLSEILKDYGEENFYLVDHYLAKEAVINLRNLIEKKNKVEEIKEIEVTLLESGDVSKRSDFYDRLGAISDVGQNHLLNIADMFFDIENIEYSPNSLILGQYDGYQNLEGVKENSQTETYFEAEFKSNEFSLKLRSGKALNVDESFVDITYQDNTKEKIIISPFNETKPAYQNLLEDFISDKKYFSLKVEKAIAAWRLIEEVDKDKKNTKLIIYKKGFSFSS